MLLLSLFACLPVPDDGSPVSACDCTTETDVTFSPSEMGGFDGWDGNALAWAVDEAAGRVLVVAMNYELGSASLPVAPACDDPDALIASWVPAIPDSAVDAAGRYPLLAGALTNSAGIQSLTEDVGVLLLEGDLNASTPDSIYVATGGDATLRRTDDPIDTLRGAFTFAAQADAIGGEAAEACEAAFRVPALGLEWPSGGTE